MSAYSGVNVTNNWMDGRTDGWTDRRMDGLMDGRTDGWMVGRMDGWTSKTDGRTHGWGCFDFIHVQFTALLYIDLDDIRSLYFSIVLSQSVIRTRLVL